jgi:hypothetical protein
LLDETFKKDNEIIQNTIKNEMIDYFNTRKSSVSQNGIFTLKNSMAGIYYLPFQTGIQITKHKKE